MTSLERGRAAQLIRAFGSRKILVVGDVMLDRFVWGGVHRISPEAPVPVVLVEKETSHPGGAANVAANLASLGARVRLASAVGNDAAAREVRECLVQHGIEASLVEDGTRTTTLKTRVLARAQQVVRVDRETEGPLSGPKADELRAQVVDAVETVDAVVVSDYDKGVVTRPLLESLLPAARRRDIPVVVDPKLPHFFAYQPITIVTPNASEAARVTAMEIRSEDDCLAAATTILERLDTRAVLITRGEQGMLLLERGEPPVFIAAVARQVYDVTGAGDTVVAVIALALAAGARVAEAAILANHAGGVVVAKVGTATVRAEEILDHMNVRA